MNKVWLQVLAKLSTWFQAVDLTGLAVSLMKLNGPLGWLASIFIKFFGHKIEKKIDQTVDDTVTTIISDTTLDDQKKSNEEKLANAQTDEQVDEAFRDSLRKH